MANEEQLRILKEEGVGAWNKWRKKNPDVQIDLNRAHLERAILRDAHLERAHLERAILSGANLERANLFYAMLATVQALKTNFSSANLTGACIEDWNINKETNLENVSCDYIYLKQGQQERLPHDLNRTFKPGEFTKYIEKALNTVDLIFLDGIDWKAFLLSLKELQDEYREENVGVQAIERKSDGAFVVRIEVPPEADKAEIESKAKQSYETKLQVLEAQYRAELQAKDREITLYKEQGSNMMEIARLLASRPINVEAKAVGTQDNRNINLDLKGASVASAYTEKIEASQVAGTVQGNQIGTQYNSPQKQTLAEAAAEIQKLLKQLEQTNPTATPEQQQAYVDAAISPTLKERCVSALKAGSETAIDEFFNNPYVKVGKAIVMAWIQP